MATCAELAKSLENEQNIRKTKQNEIDNGQIEWNKNLLWYEAIKAYWDKIGKAYFIPDDIIASLDSPINPPLDCLKIEAGNVSNSIESLIEKMEPYVKEAIQAYNETEAAASKMAPVIAAVKAIIDTKDEDFKKSKINTTLEAIFKDLEEIRVKSSEALVAALNPLKNALALKYALTGENGIVKHIGDMKKQAEECKASAQGYYEETKKEQEDIGETKNARDILIAERDAAATLVEAYTAARKAMNCPAAPPKATNP
jgi:hypothetical protein